jgi:uncharacterized membrane protein (DUF485 family)
MAVKEESLSNSLFESSPRDYTEIVKSQPFQELLKVKRAFILPLTLFFLVFYFTLPVLTAYSTVLNKPAFGPVSWAWVFGFAQFIMTWALCILYTNKAVKFDHLVEKVKQAGRGV